MHVAIIGSGILGVTSAYYLNQHGIEVTVLEKEPKAALGASYGNGGYLQASVPDPWNAPGAFMMFLQAWINSVSGKGDRSAFSAPTLTIPSLIGWGLRFLSNANEKTFLNHLIKNRNLAQYTHNVLKVLNETEQLSYSQAQSGGLIIFRDQPSMDAYAEMASNTTAHGTEMELLSRDALLQTESSLAAIADNLVGAVLFPQDNSGNSRLFCEQLVLITRSKGVNYRFDRSVSRIIPGSRRVKIRLGDGEELNVDAVVIAAGVHSRKIAASAGVPIAVAPAKGYSISVPMAGWDNPPRHLIADMGIHTGVNPLGDVLRVAGTAEFCSISKTGISETRTQYLIDLVKEIFPDFAATIDPATIDPWGGFRPLSADGLPFIGESRVKNVYLNTGHGGLGWTQGAGSSKALADLIAGVKPEFELDDYSATRFG
jgi:D-amino-acid dehydrogenase